MIIQGLASVLASLGFAIIFNIRGDKLISVSMIGGIGGITYYFCLQLGYGQVIALFVASVIISLLSEIFARIQKCPVTTFLLCALIPLVPGGGMYYTMLEVVRNNIDGAINAGADTIIQACSIVIGCMSVSSCLRMINQFKRSKAI
ncbi:MAG: threonine/serine exporter [Erysipelotrichia bacterium]|nr:threonine/serine exporter [Erysipelotrichia bacterium]NCC54551.1 threonine/serine exporter [Erysipelotrichia bacterium]